MGINDFEIEKLRAFISDMLFCIDAYWVNQCDDYKTIKNNGNLYYAIDADIMSFFLDPFENHAFARILPSYPESAQGTEFKKLLAYHLGDFIFFNPYKQDNILHKEKLFVIPPHDEEIGNILLYTFKNFNVYYDNSKEKFNRLIADIENNNELQIKTQNATIGYIKILGYIIERICDMPEYILDVFDMTGGCALGAKRFNSLERGRIANIRDYCGNGPDCIFPEIPNEIDEIIQDWDLALRRHRDYSQKYHQIRRDAKVLAILEKLNDGMKNKNERLILLTGTKSIIKAAKAKKLEDGQSFADKYIRDPRSFIIDNNFFNTNDNNWFRIFRFLNILFPEMIKIVNGGKIDKTEFKKINNDIDNYVKNNTQAIAAAYGTLEGNDGNQTFYDAFLDKLDMLIRQLLEKEKILDTDDRKTVLIDRLKSTLLIKDDNNAIAVKLHKTFLAEAQKTLESILSASSLFAIWGNKINEIEQYGIPVLQFDDINTVAQNALKELQEIYKKRTDITPEQIISQYEKLEKLDKQKNYYANVIHAFFFATRGHWFASKTLCEIALNIADIIQMDDSSDPRKGREAAYLLAISERRMAKNTTTFKESMERADHWLMEAIRRSDAKDDLRFESEKTAIKTTKVNYKWFIECAGNIMDDRCNEVEKELNEMINAALKTQQSLNDDKNLLIPEKSDYREWIFQQSLANLLNCTLILYYMGKEELPTTTLEKIKEILNKLADDSVLQEVIDNDDPANFIVEVGKVVFADSKSIPERCKLPHNKPFDKEREILFKKLANADNKRKVLASKKSRHEEALGYNRFNVSDRKALWVFEYPEYRPNYYVAHEVIEQDRTRKTGGWADPEDINMLSGQELSSYYKSSFDNYGRPQNPFTRTGIAGRGLLGKWGVNFTGDAVVSRINTKTNLLEVLLVYRQTTKEWALPGGFVDNGEDEKKTIERELREATGIDVEMNKAEIIYEGYVDDQRNTDNAWIETTAMHLHIDRDLSTTWNIKAGDGVTATEWTEINAESIQKMYANHGMIVRKVIETFKDQSGIVIPEFCQNQIDDVLKKLASDKTINV